VGLLVKTDRAPPPVDTMNAHAMLRELVDWKRMAEVQLGTLGRESEQTWKGIGDLTVAVENLAAALDATHREVLRHGRCIAPVTSIPCPTTESVAK
jgi:hypothetical protein